MKRTFPILTTLFLFFFLFSQAAFAAVGDFSLLHEFTGGDDGSLPDSQNVVISDSVIYGVCMSGTSLSNGGIYSMNTNGTDYKIIHEFTGGAGGGKCPMGSIILSGETLYGMTMNGGTSDQGVIYSISTNGDNFTVLHEFNGGAGDGSTPFGDLVLSGGTLYGMTYMGGASWAGVIFSISTNGDNFTILHEFAGGADDGAYPFGSLIIKDSKLYGMTSSGGDTNGGVIFSINTNGTDYANLHDFAGGVGDGSLPQGSLLLSDSTLYGMACMGGDNNTGVLFSIGLNGADYTILHEFTGGADDGAYPYGTLTISGTTLYGMTQTGGANDVGTLFSINTSGNEFSLLHTFERSGDNGAYPNFEGPAIYENFLYGMTIYGGDSDLGLLFKYEIELPTPPVPPSPVGEDEWNGMTSNTTDAFSGVWMNQDFEIFACGAGGRIQYYDTSVWSQMASNTTDDLLGIWGSSSSDVFAVGAGGRIQHYNGTVWSQMTSNTTDNLNNAWGTSGADVFAVGAGGRIQHYNGTDWSQMTSNTANELYGIWGASADDVFAVGAGGTIMHYNGTAWSAMASYTTTTLRAVWGFSGTDLWAVGDNGAVGHYDGANWTRQAAGITPASFGGVYGYGNEVFVVGQAGWILHYEFGTWVAMISGTTKNLAAVWGTSMPISMTNYACAVGADGTIIEFTGPNIICFIQNLLH